MKKILSLVCAAATVAGLIFSTGCSKTESVNGNIKTSTTTTTNSTASITSTYSYDNQNRLVSVVSGTSGIVYTYTGNSVIATGANNNAYLLNDKGYVGSRGKTTYTYDNDGHQISSTYSSTSGSSSQTETTNNTYSNGDLTTAVNTITQIGSGGQVNTTTTTTNYTYFTDKTDYRNNGLNFFFGKPSTHVLQTATTIYSGLSGSSTDTHSYSYDTKGRVTQDVNTSSNTSSPTTSTTTTTYTYFD